MLKGYISFNPISGVQATCFSMVLYNQTRGEQFRKYSCYKLHRSRTETTGQPSESKWNHLDLNASPPPICEALAFTILNWLPFHFTSKRYLMLVSNPIETQKAQPNKKWWKYFNTKLISCFK